MNNLVITVYHNERILSTAQLAEAYETSEKTISNNFNNNKDRYQEGKHYFMLDGELLREYLRSSNLGLQNENKIRTLYLWTEKGCLHHAKSLGTDKAWEVFEMLEETYFRLAAPKQMSQAELTAMIAQNQVEIERTANNALEIATKASTRINNAINIFSAPIERDWKQEMNARVRGICKDNGLSYLVFWGDLYKELEEVARVNLSSRQTNARAREKKGGATYKECQAISKLDIIARDQQLKLIFEGIVRKYQAKYAEAI